MSTIAEGESAPLAEGQGAPAKPKRPPLGALKAILPYASRYKGRIALAIVALVVAAGATLALPLAVRRVIDLGFDADNAAFVNEYFVALIAVAACSRWRARPAITSSSRSASASSPMCAREVFAHLTRPRAAPSSTPTHVRRDRLAPHRRHDADQIGLRRFGLGRAAQYRACSSARRR